MGNNWYVLYLQILAIILSEGSSELSNDRLPKNFTLLEQVELRKYNFFSNLLQNVGIFQDVNILLHTRKEKNGVLISDSDDLSNSTYHRDKKSKFIIQGMLDSRLNSKQLVEAFLEYNDFNIFVINWSDISYFILKLFPGITVPLLGTHIGKLICSFNESIEAKNVHIVGHSLGAHLAGIAGVGIRMFNSEKVARVTGLDPTILTNVLALSERAATFVDVIHTSGDTLGDSRPLGHADFYPNGGTSPQPGCRDTSALDTTCSCIRSYELFIESLTNTFAAYNCPSYNDYNNNFDVCNDSSPVRMGALLHRTTRGMFYLDTNDASPYAIQSSKAERTMFRSNLYQIANETSDAISTTVTSESSTLPSFFQNKELGTFQEGDVTFTLLTRSNVKGIIIDDIDKLKSSLFYDKRNKSKFIILGWLNNQFSPNVQNLINGFLVNDDVNVFVVDWGKLAQLSSYSKILLEVPLVAQSIGKTISAFILDGLMRVEDIHIIGHNLGAHIAGVVGETIWEITNDKVPRITGLDPTLVTHKHIKSLSTEAADFVDVIHTSGGSIGVLKAIGHADFYPNGGIHPQPECDDINFFMDAICSNEKSYQYYTESLINPSNRFYALKCESYRDFETDQHNCEPDLERMGEPTSALARGKFYLKI